MDPRDAFDDLNGPLDGDEDDDLGPDVEDDEELEDADGHLRAASGDPRGEMAPDDDEDGGLGPAFDLEPDDATRTPTRPSPSPTTSTRTC